MNTSIEKQGGSGFRWCLENDVLSMHALGFRAEVWRHTPESEQRADDFTGFVRRAGDDEWTRVTDPHRDPSKAQAGVEAWILKEAAELLADTSARLRVLTCVYCGHEYPQDTPAAGDQVLTDHIAQCEKHPMRKVILERDRLYAALAALVGASTMDELAELEAGIRVTPAPLEDKAAMLDAVHALRASYQGPVSGDKA